MTHPTTEPTQSIRERLARRLIDESPTVFGYHQTHIDMFLPTVDAILAEQKIIAAEQREADQRSTEKRALDDLGQSQPEWAKELLR